MSHIRGIIKCLKEYQNLKLENIRYNSLEDYNTFVDKLELPREIEETSAHKAELI